MKLLKLSGISKEIRGNPVLSNISFTQDALQKVAIAGASGAGKTTLLKIIGGLVQTSSGIVLLNGEKVPGPDEQLIPGHKSIAYVSQHFELRNNYRVEEELDYTNQLSAEAANRIFEICRINHLLKRWTDELSGGEKQRIVTARALIASPKLLLLDEPFSNLDRSHTQVMKTMIDDICNQLKISCIMVSHDALDMLSWADKIIVLQQGQLLQQGSAREIYFHPVNEYTASLFGKYNLIKQPYLKPLAALPGFENVDKNFLVRPEQFKIVHETNASAVSGIVKKISFYGSYIDMEVMVDKLTLIVRTGVNKMTVGDSIHISVSKEHIHYI